MSGSQVDGPSGLFMFQSLIFLVSAHSSISLSHPDASGLLDISIMIWKLQLTPSDEQ